jgi:hypothetical protein
MRLTEFDGSIWQMFLIDTHIIGDTVLIFHIKSLFQFLNCLMAHQLPFVMVMQRCHHQCIQWTSRHCGRIHTHPLLTVWIQFW